MPSLDEVYRKFGEAAEAAQLLETELGNFLFLKGAIAADLIARRDPEKAAALLDQINRQTLGQLINGAKLADNSAEALEAVVGKALDARNRLCHGFYRIHNNRRNSDQGREIMVAELREIHESLLDAYKAVLLHSGIDLDKVRIDDLPTEHLPI